MDGNQSISANQSWIPIKWVRVGGIVLLVVLAIVIRFALIRFVSADYLFNLRNWYTFLSQHGFSAFRNNFANYNLPYLYLLFGFSSAGVSGLLATKVIAIAFDFVLAGSVFLVVRKMRHSTYIASLAGAVALLLPTVILNGSFWGQSDVIFTSFILLSYYARITNRPLLVWIFWAVAFCFKLQAIFFLPFLLFVWLTGEKRKRFYPFVVIPIFFLPFIPALIAGRSFMSILLIYRGQIGISRLVENAASIFEWVPLNLGGYFTYAGIAFAAAVLALLIIVAIQRQQISEMWLLKFATLLLFVAPFLLPQMHDRYFFVAEIFAVVLAIVDGRRRFIAVAIVAQMTAYFAYYPFLFQTNPLVALPILTVAQLGIILVLVDACFRRVPTLAPHAP